MTCITNLSCFDLFITFAYDFNCVPSQVGLWNVTVGRCYRDSSSAMQKKITRPVMQTTLGSVQMLLIIRVGFFSDIANAPFK